MHKFEEQIHLRNIVSCLKELGDYAHYLSYERYTLDKELKNIILRNLSLAAQEAQSLYNLGYRQKDIQYLAGLSGMTEGDQEDFAIYSLLQNDLDFMMDHLAAEANKLAVEQEPTLLRQTV
ncbi:MAG: hypothetical protein ACNS60_08930 [Candidatus Cyclobacteriaceae bacterium M2_1C_046]